MTSKSDFFNQLSNRFVEPLYLTDKTGELNKEIEFNYWQLSIPDEILSETTEAEVLEFIDRVKSNYQAQLNKSHLSINLLFYLWVDEMAGQIRFNFINSNHEKLPFACKLKLTDNPEEIIGMYFKSVHRNGIPWHELKTIETPEKMEEANRLEKESHDNFVLTVYQEMIKSVVATKTQPAGTGF